MQRFSLAEPVVWSVSNPVVGGSTYAGALSAAILDVVTIRSVSTQPPMQTRPVTRSSAALSRVRIGFGITEPMTTWTVLSSHEQPVLSHS
jgi:hypothetical protein